MMEFSFGILSDTSMSYHQSHSPEFDADVETDQASVNSDDSAETYCGSDENSSNALA